MPRLAAAPRYSRRRLIPRCCRERFRAGSAHRPAGRVASQALGAQWPSSTIPRWPLVRVVIGVLKAYHRGLEFLGLRLGTILASRQGAEPGEKRYLVRWIDLNCRSDNAWIVKCAYGDLHRPSGLESQRRTAVGAESAPRLVGTGKTARLAARPFEIMGRYQGAEKSAERLLAHATMANRGTAEPGCAKSDRAALASTGMEGGAHRAISQVVPSLESLSTMPMAASSSRMRSDSLKFFAARAAARASIRLATFVSSMDTDAGRKAAHAVIGNLSNPTSCALAFRQAAAGLAPFAASARNSCIAATALGVVRSSRSASSTSAHR